MTLLFFGLFKKGVLADNIAPLITPIYEHSAAAGKTPLLLAWMAAVGFTLQLYFDFSGYTDMALGLGAILRHQAAAELQLAAEGVEHHRFLAALAYDADALPHRILYNPLVLWLTRRRAVKGQPGFGGRNPSLGAFVSLLMVPLITTMFISGLWHGAGYGFIIWGVIHGVYLGRQSWLAGVRRAPVAGSGGLCPDYEAGRVSC